MSPVRSVKKKKKIIPPQPLAVGFFHGRAFLLYKKKVGGAEELFLSVSRDGTAFPNKLGKISLKRADKKIEDISRCDHFHFFSHEENIVLTYVRHGSELAYATTKDCKKWLVGGAIKEVTKGGVLVPQLPGAIEDVMYFVKSRLCAAVSEDLEEWKIVEPVPTPAFHFFDNQHFNLIGAYPIGEFIAVFYGAKVRVDILVDINLRDEKVGEEHYLKVGAALFASSDPTRLVWQTDLPLIEMNIGEHENFSFLGITPVKDDTDVLRLYFHHGQGTVNFLEFPKETLSKHRQHLPTMLRRVENNPIVSPRGQSWESEGTFNPGVVSHGGNVHILYRAVGNDGVSSIGYAESEDGIHITHRLKKPVYTPQMPSESIDDKKIRIRDTGFSSGGGSGEWGGCEDPKLTRIGDRIYMTYVAHLGYWPMRTALTSISVEDFEKKKWNWEPPMYMSAPNIASKSVVILPEKFEGNYVIFHRVWPSIVIDTVPELAFGEGTRWLENKKYIHPRRSYWDSQKLSMGAAPIKTEEGWLAVYSAVDRRDPSKYKLGAMLLSLDDPSRVLARSRQPIISPREWYENDGKPGIIYPGGVVEREGILHVYYGGGDKVTCVATVPTEELVDGLLKERDISCRIKKASFS